MRLRGTFSRGKSGARLEFGALFQPEKFTAGNKKKTIRHDSDLRFVRPVRYSLRYGSKTTIVVKTHSQTRPKSSARSCSRSARRRRTLGERNAVSRPTTNN